MEDSILISVKKALGVQKDITAFDQDILMSINSVFSILYQIGVISSTGTYRIDDETAKWEDYFGDNPVILDMIKTYTYARVRIIFDPPSNSFVLDSLKQQAQELEWRIYIEAGSDSFDGSNDAECDHETLTDDEVKDIWKDIMGSKDPNYKDSLSDGELKEIWDEIMH